MSRTYADNAMNRRLGRVGMPHGSAVHSRSSGGGGGYSSSSSSSPRTYVDNSLNRNLGRVGMEHGTAVHSRSSSGGGGGYSSSSSTSSRCYVDNEMNRRLGRVGLPLGSAVHLRSCGGGGAYSSYSSASSSPKFYVDNALNQSLGRVGLPHGSAVHSKISESSNSSSLYNQLRRIELEEGTTVQSKSGSSSVKGSPKCYVDNAYNRRLGRVGMPLGSMVVSKSESRSAPSVGKAPVKAYVDNALNRRLGRVGKPLGSCVVSKVKCSPTLFDFNDNNLRYLEQEIYGLYPDEKCEEIVALNNLKQARCDANTTYKSSKKIDLKPEHTIVYEELELGDKIGTGGFGDVHIAIWKNRQVAVKKLRVQRVHQTKKKQFEDEVRSMTALNHPNIVRFYGACIVTPNLAIVMEFLQDGSLYDNLYYSELQFNEKTKNQFICDYFSALKYIHSKDMVHRDIKSKNILLCDQRSHCKLADFGLALKDETESNASTKQFGFAGTEKYCPEEVLEGKRLTIEELKSVDVYSLALTTFELLTEEEPFSECRNIHEIRRAIKEGAILQTLVNKDCGISSAKKYLLRSALLPNRPSADDFLKSFNHIIAAEN